MKKCLVIDSGGTKTAAILYDEDLNRLGVCVTGSLRSNTTADQLYRRHAAELVNSLGLCGITLECVRGTYEERVIGLLSEHCSVKNAFRDGEMDLGLFAAGLFGDGVLALSGTGATVFAKYRNERFSEGGYGAAVSDEGSGYYIGRQALIAAIRHYERRGQKTALTDMLAKHFGAYTEETFREAVFSIYSQKERSPVACVSGCVPTVVEAARLGDVTAKEILYGAGRIIGESVAALIRKRGLPDGIPVAVSGSVWRANPLFYDGFVSVYGKAPVIPALEPIAGAIAKEYYDRYGEADISRVASQYPEFIYDINNMKGRGI